MNDVEEVILEDWAHGARVRLRQFGNLFLSTTEFMAEMGFGSREDIYYLTSEKSDAFIFHMKYQKALLDGMDDPEALLPYPWMYDMGDIDDVDEEQEFLDFCFEHFELAPNIKCPHCEARHFRDVLYPMMRRFNISEDVAVLQCPTCGKEFEHSYNKYYEVLMGDTQ